MTRTSGLPRIAYHPRPDTTPDAEFDALAHVYRFITEAHERKQAAAGPSDGEDDAGRRFHDTDARNEYTRNRG